MKKILFLFLTILPLITFSQEFEKGKEIFTTNCAGCHNMEKQVVGPALQNTIEAQGREWTEKWILNSGELIATGDAHANEIYNEYNKQVMPAFNYLKPEEISALLDYMEGYKKDKESKAPAAVPTTTDGSEQQSSGTKNGLPFYLWIFIILTVGLVVVAMFIIIISLRLLDSHFAKIRVTNHHLMKKLNLDESEVNKNVDKIFNEEVDKRVNEKIKNLRNEIDDKLKDFK